MKTKAIILPLLFLNILASNLQAKNSAKTFALSKTTASSEKPANLNSAEINQAQSQIILEKKNIKPKKKFFKKLMISLGCLGSAIVAALAAYLSLTYLILRGVHY